MNFKPNIFKLLIIASGIGFIYFILKEINSEDDLKGYYLIQSYFFLIILVSAIFVNYFLAKIYKTYFIITILSIIFSFYLFESFIFYTGKISLFSRDKNKMEFLKLDIQKEIKKQGGFTYFSINKTDLISFSGISNKKIVFCNESGFYSTYKSDRYGFNNPDYEWDNIDLDAIVLGDSFVHGGCVNQGDDMTSQLRKLGKLKTINLGWSATGPLKQFAAYLEYIDKIPKYLFWVYFENDLIDLKNELNSSLLINYFNDINFRQNLKTKRKKIDQLLFEKHNEFMQRNFDTYEIDRFGNLKNFIKLYKTRQLLMFNISKIFKMNKVDNNHDLNASNELKFYFKILDKMRELTITNNTELVLVYIPSEKYEFTRKFKYLHQVKNAIFEYMNKNDIGIIDIEKSIKEDFFYPNKLYPKESPEFHFNEFGYKYVAEKMLKYINNN